MKEEQVFLPYFCSLCWGHLEHAARLLYQTNQENHSLAIAIALDRRASCPFSLDRVNFWSVGRVSLTGRLA
jgi:hypothetical protein